MMFNEIRKNMAKDEKITHVDMIASGYEWDCPACGSENMVDEVPKMQDPVVCTHSERN